MMKNSPVLIGLALAASALLVGTASGQEPPGPPRPPRHKENVPMDPSKLPAAADQKEVTYSKDIKPIFEQSCARCHGAERPKAHLRMDSLEGVLKGSEDGKVVVPGDSGKSPMMYSVAHVGDPQGFMPPPRNKANIGPLTQAQVALIRAWIDQGAK